MLNVADFKFDNITYNVYSANQTISYKLLDDDGLIICESDNLDKIVYTDKFKSVKDKKYGDKYIVLLQKI